MITKSHNSTFSYIDEIFHRQCSIIFPYQFRRIVSAPTSISQKYVILSCIHMVYKKSSCIIQSFLQSILFTNVWHDIFLSIKKFIDILLRCLDKEWSTMLTDK